MIERLICEQSKTWDSSESETALELIRLLLHRIEKNELTRREVDHSAINEMYVGWCRLKAELIRKEKLIAQDGR